MKSTPAWTVGAVTTTGPRPTNEDRYITRGPGSDGAWVIAVADGVSGSAEPHRAARAAVEGIPESIESLDEMRGVFLDAAARVAALTPTWEEVEAEWRSEYDDEEEWRKVRFPPDGAVRIWATDSEFDRRYGEWTYSCPATTLCVAAWTTRGGLLVGSIGDTLAFDVQWRSEAPTSRRLINEPHRQSPGGVGVRSYLRSGLSETFLSNKNSGRAWGDGYCTNDFCAMKVPDAGPGTVARAVIVASDGAWEEMSRLYWAARRVAEDPCADVYASPDPATAAAAERDRRIYGPRPLPADWPRPPLGDLGEEPPDALYRVHSGMPAHILAQPVAALLPSPAPAATTARTVLATATALGLDDNATVAAAVTLPHGRPQPTI